MYIINTAAYYLEVNDQTMNLKQEVKASCGKHVRRIDRFIQLALIGSHRCVKDFDLPMNTGLYLSSGEGPKVNIHESLEQTHKYQLPLMPLNFINMVGNSASFYIASSLSIQGANIFNSDDCLAIQNALLLAELDLQSGASNYALIGCTDEAAEPLAIQRDILGIAHHAAIGEGSYWLLATNHMDNAIGKIQCNIQTHQLAVLNERLKAIKSTKNTLVCLENNLSNDEKKHLLALVNKAKIWDYQREIARHRCESGYAITAFFNPTINQNQLVHISKDRLGNYALVIAKKL